MGYTEVRTHVRISNEADIKKLEQYLSEFGTDELYVQQKDYVTLNAEMVSFENFEEVAVEISATLKLNVFVSLVYDSDVAVLQGYVNGDKKYEEVKSLGENVEMDRQQFVQDFFPDCKVSDINEVLDKTDYLFAEDRLFELGDVLGLELLEP